MKKEPRLYDLPPGKLYGGRTDLVAEVDDILWVLDWKTGKKPKDALGYAEWPLQTAAYRAGILDARRNGVIHLDKATGLPTVYDYSNTFQKDLYAFNDLVRFWRNRYADKLNGTNGPSVTTVTGILEKPALVAWAANSACDYILMNLPKANLQTGDILSLIEKARKEYRSISREAMDLGTAVHACIEQWLRTRVEPKIEDDRVLAGFLAFLEWFDDHKVKVIEIEKVIYG